MEKPCPEFESYALWFEQVVVPQFRKLFAHIADCPQCQAKFSGVKDQMGLELLKISEKEFFDRMREEADKDEG